MRIGRNQEKGKAKIERNAKKDIIRLGFRMECQPSSFIYCCSRGVFLVHISS